MHYVYESVQSVINKPDQDVLARHGHVPSLAIIVPILNEIERLPLLLKELASTGSDKVIIVDGGSNDGTLEWLEKYFSDNTQENMQLIQAPSGRARQMNIGAKVVKQDVLLFLHADTVLPSCAKQDVVDTLSEGFLWGRFNVAFDEKSHLMSMIAFFINARSRLTGIATGDQAMFMSRELFLEVGGFDDIALMEDVAMSKKMSKLTKSCPLQSKVVTSARRWKKNGVIRTVIKMWWYRLAYFFGVSPDSLAQGYRNIR